MQIIYVYLYRTLKQRDMNIEIEKQKTIDSLNKELKELENLICLPETRAAKQKDARIKKVKRMLRNVDKLYA